MFWLFFSCSSGNNITCSVVDCPPKVDDTGIITGASDLSDPEPIEYEELDTGTWPEGTWVNISAGGWHTCAIDKDAQMKKMIEFERERQFTTFSTLYYKRIYNSAVINEK